ncbi:MAG TPA: CGNR zinc finger domain-containing protein [Rugosimonospora sp.]|nr:CGNR zinc finger domain-containing protein [Rugosimonospora sp.]
MPDEDYMLRYEDYLGNVARLAVDLVNSGAPVEPASAYLLTEHAVPVPAPGDLAGLVPLLRAAVAAVVDRQPPQAVNRLLSRYPPRLSVTDHDGPGTAHLHYAPDGEPAVRWIGRTCGAALAHIACGTPEVTLGRCQAAGCGRFFVDQSRNRSRRFCGNTCASRTTVAAHRARQRSTVDSGGTAE